MYGRVSPQRQLFSSQPLDALIPEDHVLRKIRVLTDEALAPVMRALESSYSTLGRPSVPPEVLLRSLLLQALFSIRSEVALCEQIRWNPAYRWFVGLDWDDAVFDNSSFSKNRERLLGHGASQAFFGEVVRLADAKGLLRSDRLVVDGTQIKAWAAMKSFKANDGSDDDKPNFKGTKRSNKTHSSRTDPEARLYRKGKGQESMLCYLGHVLVDGVSGIVRNLRVTLATGTAEVDAALEMVDGLRRRRGKKIVGDRLYDQTRFVDGIRERGATPHVRAKSIGSRMTKRTRKTAAYEASMKVRYIVEGTFGWCKSIGGMRQTKFHGREKVEWQFTVAAAARNLVLMANCA
jgi:transposase